MLWFLYLDDAKRTWQGAPKETQRRDRELFLVLMMPLSAMATKFDKVWFVIIGADRGSCSCVWSNFLIVGKMLGWGLPTLTCQSPFQTCVTVWSTRPAISYVPKYEDHYGSTYKKIIRRNSTTLWYCSVKALLGKGCVASMSRENTEEMCVSFRYLVSVRRGGIVCRTILIPISIRFRRRKRSCVT